MFNWKNGYPYWTEQAGIGQGGHGVERAERTCMFVKSGLDALESLNPLVHV